MIIRNFEDLEIWQLSRDLAIDIYKLTSKFPRSEQFGLTPQIRSAAVSVSANIAEGFGRYHLKDKINFFYNARGSLLEVQSHFLIAEGLGLVEREDLGDIPKKVKNLGIKINNFIGSLKNYRPTTE